MLISVIDVSVVAFGVRAVDEFEVVGVLGVVKSVTYSDLVKVLHTRDPIKESNFFNSPIR